MRYQYKCVLIVLQISLKPLNMLLIKIVSRLIKKKDVREMVEIGIRSLLTGMIEEKMKGKVPKNQWLTPERIAAYYSQTMTYIMMTWIESGMEISPEELVEVYGFMITRSLADVLADI